MKDFLKYTFASLLGSLLGLALIAGIGFGGLILLIVAAASKDAGPQVKEKSLLVLDLSLNISDSKPTPRLEDALSEERPDTVTLRAVLDAIAAAQNDSNIVGVYIAGTSDTANTGLANLREVRAALQRFQKAGKPIYAYDMDWTEREYYLASIANNIALNPLGSMELNGLSSEPMFLTGALEKFGIGVQVTRVGKYKSAIEPFVLKKMSPENRQQTQQLLNDIWSEFLRTVAPTRKLNPQQLQTIADNQGLLTAEEARSRKLVDKLAYYDEIVAELKKITGTREKDKSFEQISVKNYARIAEKKENGAGKNRIALVYAEGDIVDGEGGVNQVGGDRLAKELRQVREDEKVKAVVLRVNSPGGSATASEVINREVALTRQKKPVIVSMGSMAASGGYWISMNGNRIFAEPNTITGSIGVFGMLLNVQKLATDNGISWDAVKTARFADLGTISRPKTPQELAGIQRMTDRIYNQFISKVATSRKLPVPKVQEIAQGRVWSGAAAKQLGLVDEIGGLETAIQAAAKQAKLEKDWQIEEYPKSRSLEERILERLAGSTTTKASAKLDPLTAEWQKIQQDLVAVKALNDPQGIYARLPFNLRID